MLGDTVFDSPHADGRSDQPSCSVFRRIVGRARELKATRFAVATLVATAFGILEYISHRLLLALQFTPDVQAICDGSIVAVAGALTAWVLLVASGSGHSAAVFENSNSRAKSVLGTHRAEQNPLSR